MGIIMVETFFLLATKFSLHKPIDKYSSRTLVQITIRLFHSLVNEIIYSMENFTLNFCTNCFLGPHYQS